MALSERAETLDPVEKAMDLTACTYWHASIESTGLRLCPSGVVHEEGAGGLEGSRSTCHKIGDQNSHDADRSVLLDPLGGRLR